MAEGLSVRDIFSRFGEPRVREIERDHLKKISESPASIVALGGGAYVDPENRRVVEDTGISVWLDASFSSIRERVRPDGTRPLLADPDHARKLYAERLPSYRLARIHVLTDNRLPDAIAKEIVERVTEL